MRRHRTPQNADSLLVPVLSDTENDTMLRDLAAEHGSPLFIFYPDRFRQNVETYRGAFESAYPNVTLAYSTKTNYVPEVVRVAIDCGVVPEAIPGMELDILQGLGALNSDAIINGPLKTREELERIVSAGARINVDNWTELEVLNAIALNLDRTVDIGIRVCGSVDDATWLRFGFDHDSGLARKAAVAISEEFGGLRLVGLHIHLGTNLLDEGIYEKAAQLLCGFSGSLVSDGLMKLQYLDLGGGFATDCPFLDSSPGAWHVPSAEEYAQAIAKPLLEAFPGDQPELIVEPGRALVDDTFDMLTTVRRMRGGSNEVIVDAGQNVFSSCRYRKHPVSVVGAATNANAQSWTLFGPLCMQSDCIGRDIVLPTLEPGTLLKVGYAGAYSLSQSWRFIRYPPAVISLENGAVHVLRHAENAESIRSNYVFNG
jgi:diaminopimelate decarboxylase